MTDQNHTTTSDKLRSLADLLDAHPDLPTPVITAFGSGSVQAAWQLMNIAEAKKDQRTWAIRIRRALGGTWRKKPWQDRFDFHTERDGVDLAIYAHCDQVCERVVTGTETVTIPAVDAQAAQPERTEEREVVEWRCDPVLVGDDAEQPATVAVGA